MLQPQQWHLSWVTLGKSPDLSEPQQQVEGLLSSKWKTVSEPVASQLLRKCLAAPTGVPPSGAEGCWGWGHRYSHVAFGEG